MNCRQLRVGVDFLICNQQQGIDSSQEPCDSLADRLWRSHDSADKGAGFISECVSERCWRWCQQTGWKPSIQWDTSSLWLCSFWSSLLFAIHPSLSLSLSVSLSQLSLLHSQMSDHRCGTWHTSFCLLSSSNSLISSPAPSCSYLHISCIRAHMHICAPASHSLRGLIAGLLLCHSLQIRSGNGVGPIMT